MASTVSKDKVWSALEALGLDLTEDNCAQLQTLSEAMFIYQERERARGGLWKQAGAFDSAHHLQSKARRVTFAIEHGKLEAVIDDGLDAVNYAAFAVRNVRAERIQPT